MTEEIGALEGAQFRILVPATWNGVLVLWCDGYRPSPGTFQKGKGLSKFALALVEQGYAVAESGYSKDGLAVDEAFRESHTLRGYFLKKHSDTKAVYVLGESMGGLISLTLVESYPTSYAGGLSFCGMLGSPFEYTRRVFDLLTLFHYFYPEVLPPPSEIPATFRPTETLMSTVEATLARSPNEAGLLRNQAGVHTNKELAPALVFHTDLLRDLTAVCGGNPFDNRSTIYVAGTGSIALNERLHRNRASPAATECVKRMKAPRGNLLRPFLAVDSGYDPIVPGWFVNEYENVLAGSPSALNFVRQFISGSGHCSIPIQTRLGAFQDLVKWVGLRAAPEPGLRRQ
jgi:hypothetical protein